MSVKKTDLVATFNGIPRSATRRHADQGAESRPLSDGVERGAFVLLAEPGGGKSRAFMREAQALGGRCVGGGRVSRRDKARDIVRGLVNQLGAADDSSAAEELQRLRELPALAA